MITFDFDFDFGKLDFELIHRWLSHTYWSPGISRARVEKGFAHSTLCVGAYCDGQLVGVARVVSDTTRATPTCRPSWKAPMQSVELKKPFSTRSRLIPGDQ